MLDRKVFADELGVWASEVPGRRFGIEWDEIYSVGGYKLNAITEVYTCVTFDFEYGEFFEISDSDEGFDAVLEAIDGRLPGLPQGWIESLRSLPIDDSHIDIWQR